MERTRERPGKARNGQGRVFFYLDRATIQAIDRARGGLSKTAWHREAALEKLKKLKGK